jgi:hypothetical protein
MTNAAHKIQSLFGRRARAQVEFIYVTDTPYRRPDVIVPARLGA